MLPVELVLMMKMGWVILSFRMVAGNLSLVNWRSSVSAAPMRNIFFDHEIRGRDVMELPRMLKLGVRGVGFRTDGGCDVFFISVF